MQYENGANPYEFGYKIADEYGNTQHRQESGDSEGNKQGSYGYSDAYGLYRNVEYVADGYGFKAYVNSNEPGVGNQDPADVKLEKSGHAHSETREDIHKVALKALPAPQPIRRAHPRRPVVRARPSYNALAIAQLPDPIHAPIILRKRPIQPVPRIQAVRKVPVAALLKDELAVPYREPHDFLRIPAPGPAILAPPPTPHPNELKTFTEKPAHKPEYRPRFASKSNY